MHLQGILDQEALCSVESSHGGTIPDWKIRGCIVMIKGLRSILLVVSSD